MKMFQGIMAVFALAILGLSASGPIFASGPSQPVPSNPCSRTPVLTLHYHAINDEDSGFVGYWALDHYAKTVQVYNEGSYYCAWETYDGGWQTFQGALSPQNGVTESRDGAGNFNGYLELLFTATSVTSGTFILSTQNYGGTMADILLGSYGNGQTGNTNTYDWTAHFTTGFAPYGSNYEPIWGFYYFMGNTLGWTNAYSGSSGDIVV